MPCTERRQSCLVAETESEMLVFDLGNGAMRGMLRAGIDPLSVDRIFLTHFHPDHTTDIVPLLFSIKYGAQTPRTHTLSICGPKPFREFWTAITSAWGEFVVGDYPIELSELPRECVSPIDLPGSRLSWAPAEHRPESIAYRLDSESGSLVYTGDTEYAGTVVALARGAHTLIVECSFPDDSPVPGHLTPAGAARIAREADVERVVLTHLYPPVDNAFLPSEVARGFDGEVVVAKDGLKLEL